MRELERGAAHVWLVRPDAVDAARLATYDALLAPDERARVRRLRREEHRRERLVARALVRTTLSRYAGVAPAAWTFVAGADGRPEIAGPVLDPPLRFNLSHTSGLVACAVTLADDVGVDVEDVRRPRSTLALATRYFAPAEVTALRALAPEAQRARFFEIWTLKEAYVKARGLGLRLPLHQFAFAVAADARVDVEFDPRLGDDPARWHFALRRPTAHHQLALAIRHDATRPLTIEIRPETSSRVGSDSEDTRRR